MIGQGKRDSSEKKGKKTKEKKDGEKNWFRVNTQTKK